MPRVLMLHTGGTLAMEATSGPPTGVLRPSQILQRIYDYVPEIKHLADVDFEVVCNLDSTEMAAANWFDLAQRIAKRMADYDGFVVTHGTDAMAYTATALSFALRDLPKPVIVTGSQKPLGDVRTDARLNLLGAVELAALVPCGEVGIYFGNRLYRANRTRKVDSESFEAFESPNHPVLADLGIHLRTSRLLREPGTGPTLHVAIEPHVMALAIHPGFDPALLQVAGELGARGMVLLGLGCGNLPVGDGSLLRAIERLVANGTTIVLGSQVPRGRMALQRYEGGARARELGVLSSYDMTFEATLIKLMFALAETDTRDALNAYWRTDLSGELSRVPREDEEEVT